jgi:hypothetical protein
MPLREPHMREHTGRRLTIRCWAALHARSDGASDVKALRLTSDVGVER